MGATNRLPEDPALDAFADRFLARVFVDPVSDARLEELLEAGWQAEPAVDPLRSLMAALDRLSAAAQTCDHDAVQPLLGVAVRRLRAAGVMLSDRRVVRAQRLVAAAATLDGRSQATAADLWVLPLVAPTADAQVLARETLIDLLAKSANTSLLHAAEEYSRGPLARAERLVETGRALLDGLGLGSDDRDALLRVEATLREIDAGFSIDDLTPSLQAVREDLIAVVHSQAGAAQA